MNTSVTKKDKKSSKFQKFKKDFKRHYPLYLFMLPMILHTFIFSYTPMYGIQIAFKDFYANKGILGSPWAGLKHFKRFFNSYYFERLLKNTLSLSLYNLALFPLPIIFSLMLNELRNERFKKLSQTLTYAPYFISTVVVVGMLVQLLDSQTGLINNIIVALGGKRQNFLTDPDWFRHVYVWSGQWQGLGWGTIIYLAALAGVDPELHEAAKVDGASRIQRIIYINIPAILPTVITLFILSLGSFMSTGFEKVLLLQNNLNASKSDIIQTHVYETGLLGGQYSYSAAIGLFESLVNLILLTIGNKVSDWVKRKFLW